MFVTKRIHPGAFPMNGKFTRLLFLKTAKSKKRKTCRNIFFFRTIHTTFPTYICICWPWLAPTGSGCSCPPLPLRLPLRLPQPAPACPENKSGLKWAQHARNALPRHKTWQKRAHQTPLGHKKDRKCAQPAQKVALGNKTGRKRAHDAKG